MVAELLIALNRSAHLGLHSEREFSPDPPDCVCLNAEGELVAIEVVEVVCEQAVRLNARGNWVYRHWRPGELASKVAQRLAEKDEKRFHGGPYAAIIACLFTDEPALSYEQAIAELSLQGFGPFRQLSSAYLLFSYQPATQSYPVLQLQIVK